MQSGKTRSEVGKYLIGLPLDSWKRLNSNISFGSSHAFKTYTLEVEHLKFMFSVCSHDVGYELN